MEALLTEGVASRRTDSGNINTPDTLFLHHLGSDQCLSPVEGQKAESPLLGSVQVALWVQSRGSRDLWDK